jgi:methylmalonyl-CoA mutase N-terminal domain/subunit
MPGIIYINCSQPSDQMAALVLLQLLSVQAAGLEVDQVAPRLSFFFAVGLNFYEEIAKLRAARRLWARMVKQKFNPRKEGSLILRYGCHGGRQGE